MTVNTVTEPLHSPSKQRYLFIDLYRSFIIFIMLEGHFVRVVLQTDLQQTQTFITHELFHGITAPAFLFGSGLTFVISTRKKWEEYHHWGRPLAKRVGKFAFILLLALVIHLPFLSFRKLFMEGTTKDYLQLFQADVLTCISLGLLSLHGLIFFFKNQARFYALVFLTVLATCFLTPIVWDIDFTAFLPPVLSQLFNSMHGSQFPLFPFVGFLFSGVLISWEFLVASKNHQERKFMRQIAIGGAGLILVGLLFEAIPLQVYPTRNFWYTSPNYFLIRSGALLLLTSASWHIAQSMERTPSLVTVMGKESLFIYILHLIPLYGSVFNIRTNITRLVGPTLSIAETAGSLALFVGIMIVSAYLWHFLKTRHTHFYRLLQLAAAGWFLWVFFTRDY